MSDVTAELALFFPDGKTVPEGELATLDPGSLGEMDQQQAIVTLKTDGSVLQIGDDLSNLLSALCMDVPKALLADGSAEFYGFASDTAITFTRSGDTTATESADFLPASFPADALNKALVGVAVRFADAFPRLWPDDPYDVQPGFATAAGEAASAVGLG